MENNLQSSIVQDFHLIIVWKCCWLHNSADLEVIDKMIIQIELILETESHFI